MSILAYDPSMSFSAKLQHWACAKPNDIALQFLSAAPNETGRLSFCDLNQQAQRLSGRMIRAGLSGKPVLLPAQSVADFVVAICGCIHAGAIAVPCPIHNRKRGNARMQSIARDARIAAMLAIGEATSERLADVVPDVPVVSLSRLEGEDGATKPQDPHAPTLLQYTSGSTGSPKGVIVTNRNLSANIAMLSRAFGVRHDSRVLTWLPLFHDMGLIGNVLAALYCGVPCAVMPPQVFLQKPLRWLEAISRHGVTISGAPNFAYELCVRRLGEGLVEPLDLRSWKLAVCAAEPVRLSTMRRFTDAFAPHGFSEKALYPCYGLAEATVFVSGGQAGEAIRTLPSGEGVARNLVSCGQPAPGTLARIVDPDTCRAVTDGSEGEIWLRGDHVAAGYWNNPAATAATFRATLADCADDHLRTGDLGVMRNGELYITGRRKDLIIYRGTNLHPEDIEATIGASDGKFGLAGAVFALDVNNEDQVVAAYEINNAPPTKPRADAMIESALKAVAREHGVRLFDLVLLRAGALPRTTSGKVRRDECRKLYVSGDLARGAYDARHRSLGRHQNSLAGGSDTALSNRNPGNMPPGAATPSVSENDG
jgi:acyl-CoA synthetase (AMP-forming)/AMP-acid ligase II